MEAINATRAIPWGVAELPTSSATIASETSTTRPRARSACASVPRRSESRSAGVEHRLHLITCPTALIAGKTRQMSVVTVATISWRRPVGFNGLDERLIIRCIDFTVPLTRLV